MNRSRWLITIALGLAPMLAGMAIERPGNLKIGLSAAASSSSNTAGKSSGKSSSSSSSSSSTSSSSSSSSSSSVSVGIAPKAKVTNPHGPISMPCANCHTYSSWKPIRSKPEFNHDQTGYPLRGMHGNVGCVQCHTSMVFKNVGSQCADCHADIHRRQFGANCSQCHSVKGWQTSLQAIRNHSNRFPLVGAHAMVQCEECHKQAAVGQFVGLSTGCYSCHQQDFKTPVLDHIGLGFPTDCSSCHSLDSWFNAKFDHLKYTGYPLTGTHATLPCVACHINNVFKGTPAQCYSCHQADFTNSNNPPHLKLGLPRDCAICHSTTDWMTTTFDHALYAHYPLTGKHATVPCAQCHANNSYNNTPTDCYSCHKSDFQGTNNPPHVSGGFPTDCSLCHTTAGWTTSTFDHSKTTFPLTGAHLTVQCALCHTNNNYSGSLPTDCYSCHQADYKNSKAPPHAALPAMFPTTCQTCHTTANWTSGTFNHNVTPFPLTGAHATVPCASCHINNNYSPSLGTDCYSCHQKDYAGTTNPNHAAAGYPTTCATCHNTTSWISSTFNHNTTGFPLTGAHVSVPCASCHVNNNYSGSLPTDCYGCHQADYKNSKAPPHAALPAMFPTTCQTCHTTANWTSGTFNHNVTPFPLTGAHATVPCASCHINNNYSPSLGTDCYGCHQKDYTGTTNPNHVAAKYPTTCATCHNTTSWLNSTFNHSTTGFPLTGAHMSVPCASCHVNNNYNLTAADTACYSCHKADYTGTNAPPHATLASFFPTTCETCHTTANWTSGTFNHNATSFPLTGAHTTVACATCHTNNNYTTLATTCWGCHQADYNAATAPPHLSSNFPHDCTVCHSTTTWGGSNFNHSAPPANFPLVGAHTALLCSQCHVNNNYNLTAANTTCYSCHQADFTGAKNPPHAGFPTDCTTCHGAAPLLWTTANFNHGGPPANFPLVGAHTALTCVQCHINNNYNLTAANTTCISCHQADFTGANNPPHAGFPTDCTTCHGAAPLLWTTATFNHGGPPANFPLVGAHTALQCVQCHINNNYNLTAANTTCISCHQADFTGANNPPHASFPTDCTTCHGAAPLLWTTATFNHGGPPANFPLVGAHTALQCVQCHINNNYNLTAANTTCISCHQADFTAANNPPHTGFPTDCTTCHGAAPLLWTTATFNHGGPPANFPLVGAHTALQCVQCHINNNYNLTAANTTCISCHQADFTGANNPVHTGFPTDCTTCHGAAPLLWTTATFNHSGPPANFPLVGFHATLTCVQCHINNNYNLTAANTACYSCHQADFTGTNNPSHLAAGFPTTCNTCHTNNDWTVTGMNFNHTLYANWALTGFHATMQCVQCHTSNNFNNLATACYSCHAADYNGTTNPNHKTANYPTTCETCHSTTNWTSATFDHSTTGFPLTGFHTTMACIQCHTNNNYSLTAANALCSACHMTDYNGTTNPAHAAAGFPTTCDTCHTTTDWTGATFNHNNTPFPLTGAHTSVACTACHINNVFVGTPTDCYSCHKADFAGTTNPNHTTAGWPTTCTTCHTTTNWTSATLPTSYHTFFPLNHGNANGVCTTCHTNSSDYSVFTCTGCHGGNNAANFKHPSVNGYVYNSVNCLACHKNGGGG